MPENHEEGYDDFRDADYRKHIDHEIARDKRRLKLIERVASPKVFKWLREEEFWNGVFPGIIVSRRDIKARGKKIRRAIRRHPGDILDAPKEMSHYYNWQEVGYLGDDYFGEIWYYLGKGKYLFCHFSM